ncbi:MAG: 5'/3'-nucleotidase SurE [Christensenellaceae bacterium]|jgi:5'-nucleotidase|nr:5'/3'-nucleotidase SurE [Christensenellaceae bacterium]
MNILLVNDDGYASYGITRLADALIERGASCIVVAPDKCKSGMSHAESFRKPVMVNTITGYNYPCYSVSGTPCDCVLIGLHIVEVIPDLIVSGVNAGTNLGTEIVYSGTVNAAIEGAIRGVKSVALSVDGNSLDAFDFAIDDFISKFSLYTTMPSSDSAISINYPRRDAWNNKRVLAVAGIRNYDERYTVTKSENSYIYVLDGMPLPDPNPACDAKLFDEGYITITPLACDFTNYTRMGELKSKWIKL